MGAKSVPPELRDLADQIGEFLQYWGFKKVHGRIWTHLLLSRTPLDASDLIQRLGISKALVSMSLSDMLEYEVIEDMGKSDRGTVIYRINADVMGVIRNVLRSRERRLVARITAAYKLVRSLPPADLKAADIDADKLKALGKLIHSASRALDSFLLRFRFDLTVARRFILKSMDISS